jgi:purine-nucleoside phosphorylase
MTILGFSVITNMNIPDDFKPARVEDIIAAAEQTAPSLQAVIRGVLEKLPA